MDENVQVTEVNTSGLYRMDSNLKVSKWATVRLDITIVVANFREDQMNFLSKYKDS